MALAKIIVGDAENVNDLSQQQRALLADFFISLDPETNTITVDRPFGGGVAGSAQSLEDLRAYFRTDDATFSGDVAVAVAFPTSAGPGLGGVALSPFDVIAAPDPKNEAWNTVYNQPRFYNSPATDGENEILPAANGMGSTVKNDNIVAMLADG